MFKTKSFEDNIYMKLFRLAYIFLAGNICFLLVNLPLFIVIITTALDPRNSLFFILASIPVLPATLTLMAWLDEWKKEKEINPFQLFFRLYKNMWKESFKLGGIGFFVGIIALSNAFLLSQFPLGKWFSFFFIILFIGLIAWVLNNFYFYLKNRTFSITTLYTTSLYFTLKKWYYSLLNVALVVGALIMMALKPQFGFLLTNVVLFGLIYLNCTNLYITDDEPSEY